MFTIIVCSLIILYCIIKLVYLNEFVVSIYDADPLPGVDALMSILIIIWFIVQLFLYSGPVIIAALIAFIIIDAEKNTEWEKKIFCTKTLLLIVIAVNMVIGINHVQFKFSMWKELFALI